MENVKCKLGQDLKSASVSNPGLSDIAASAARIISDMESYTPDIHQVQVLYGLLEGLDERHNTTLLRNIHQATNCPVCSELSEYSRHLGENGRRAKGARS